MNILAIDSSGKSASAAILKEDKLIGETFLNTGYTHSETLLPMIINLLSACKTELSEIDMIAANRGPGSFTGLRIGLSVAKGLAFSQETMLFGTPTLLSLAYNVKQFDGIICPVMDARRNEFYNALFEGQSLKRLSVDRAISAEGLYFELSKLNKRVILVGDGARIAISLFPPNENIGIAEENLLYPRAGSVAFTACLLLKQGEKAGEFMPEYLRMSQAEREYREKQKKESEIE